MKQNMVTEWGLSMYGGYYAQGWFDGKYDGIHADKLKDLKAELARRGITKLDADRRADH